MSLQAPSFVLGYWIFVSVFSFILISSSLYVGLRKKFGIIFWREAKLISSIIGSVGIVSLLISFDSSTHEQFGTRSIQLAKEELLDTKFLVAEYLHDHCPSGVIAGEDKNTCFDFKNIDRQLSMSVLGDAIEHSRKLKNVENLPKNPVLSDQNNTNDPYSPLNTINSRINLINGLMKTEYKTPVVSDEEKLNFSMFSILFVVIALAGTVGEAAFQLRIEIDRNAMPTS